MTYDDKVAMCALNKVFGYTPAAALKLLAGASSPAELFDGREPRLNADEWDWALGEIEKVESGGFRFLTILDDDYPDILREIADPPIGLYLNGSTSPAEIFSLRPMVAFVGTRDLSPYGRAWCRKLVAALADARIQPTVVSGLALGADGASHRAALESGLPTIGVMATGIESIYPWLHRDLAAEMVRTPGCAVVTDYPMGTSPVAHNFLRRNRIIAGLSRAVVVVESKTRGGSLMTARFATEYSREVYALPGRADDIRSAGCNSLIHAHMAEIVTSPEELVDALGLGGGQRHRGAGGSWAVPLAGETPSGALRRVLERKYGPGAGEVSIGLAVQERRGITAEELAASLGLPFAEILSGIGTLEADGILSSDLLRRCALTSTYDYG